MASSSIHQSTPIHSSHAKLNLIIALTCEARPLIDALRLKKSMLRHPFTIYHNEQANIHLIISGVGGMASSAATAYVHAITQQPQYAFYINLGIAGSAVHSLGSLHSVNKIIDHLKGDNYYPFLWPEMTCQRSHCTTYPKPQLSYAKAPLIDMEAAAFFSTAQRCVTQEYIQVFKIVSDTPHNSATKISASFTTQLIEKNIEQLLSILQALMKLSANEYETQHCLIDLQPFLSRWHFTAYQQNVLHDLLRRWHILHPNQSTLAVVNKAKNSQEVLLTLQQKMSSYA